jgi:hypothetical protein
MGHNNLLQMKPFSDRLTLTDLSLLKKNAAKGKSIGDDICWYASTILNFE